jgi:hypothetical protein
MEDRHFCKMVHSALIVKISSTFLGTKLDEYLKNQKITFKLQMQAY